MASKTAERCPLVSSLSRSSLTLRTAQICPPGLSSTQYSLPQKTAHIHLSGSHPASTTISLNCAILTPSGHCPNFLPSKHCAQKFRSQARATLCAISVINPAPCHLELRNVQLLGLLSFCHQSRAQFMDNSASSNIREFSDSHE